MKEAFSRIRVFTRGSRPDRSISAQRNSPLEANFQRGIRVLDTRSIGSSALGLSALALVIRKLRRINPPLQSNLSKAGRRSAAANHHAGISRRSSSRSTARATNA
jgi:hypothetical protein